MLIGVFVSFVALVSTICGAILQKRHDKAEKLAKVNKTISGEIGATE